MKNGKNFYGNIFSSQPPYYFFKYLMHNEYLAMIDFNEYYTLLAKKSCIQETHINES